MHGQVEIPTENVTEILGITCSDLFGGTYDLFTQKKVYWDILLFEGSASLRTYKIHSVHI